MANAEVHISLSDVDEVIKLLTDLQIQVRDKQQILDRVRKTLGSLPIATRNVSIKYVLALLSPTWDNLTPNPTEFSVNARQIELQSYDITDYDGNLVKRVTEESPPIVDYHGNKHTGKKVKDNPQG